MSSSADWTFHWAVDRSLSETYQCQAHISYLLWICLCFFLRSFKITWSACCGVLKWYIIRMTSGPKLYDWSSFGFVSSFWWLWMCLKQRCNNEKAIWQCTLSIEWIHCFVDISNVSVSFMPRANSNRLMLNLLCGNRVRWVAYSSMRKIFSENNDREHCVSAKIQRFGFAFW